MSLGLIKFARSLVPMNQQKPMCLTRNSVNYWIYMVFDTRDLLILNLVAVAGQNYRSLGS